LPVGAFINFHPLNIKPIAVNKISGLLLLLLIAAATRTNAANYKGGELLYEWVGDSTYQVTLKLYGACTGGLTPAMSTSVCYYNDCNSQSGHIDLLPVAIPSPASPAYLEYWYRGNITLPSRCNNWVFYTSIGSRDSSKNSQYQPGHNIYLEASLNNRAVQGNSSPSFNSPPPAIISNSLPYALNPGTADTNGDSLSFELLSLRTAPETYNSPAGCRSNYVASNIPFSSTAYNLTNNPFATGNTFTLNPLTGQMSFTPQDTGAVAYVLRVHEYRGGVKIGSVMRDAQMTISGLMLTPQPLSGISHLLNCVQASGRLSAAANVPMGFCMNAWIGNNNVTHLLGMVSNLTLVMPGSSTQLTGQYSDSVSLCFTWTPSSSDTGLHLLTYTVRDSTVFIPCITALTGIVDAAQTIPVFIYPATNVGTVNNSPAVKLYPNPAKNTLYIETSTPVETTVYNLDGRMLATTSGKVLDIATLAGGLYFVRICDVNGRLIQVEKLMKLTE
jgi:hypothetical protein